MKTMTPKGAAVHTRDIERGKDYGWYAKRGVIWLFDRVEDIYRTTLRDTSGETRKFAVIIAERKAGFLLCDMPCKRIDHGNRVIYDTLYREFEKSERFNLLEYAAQLLTCSDEDYKTVEQQAIDYAEWMYHNNGQEDDGDKKVKNIPFIFDLGVSDQKRFFGKSALKYDASPDFSNNLNVQKCASYLRWLYRDGQYYFEKPGASFAFVSTGRVGVEKCRQFAAEYKRCLVLTMTSEIETEADLYGKSLKGILTKERDLKGILSFKGKKQ